MVYYLYLRKREGKNMCGRYHFSEEQSAEIHAIIQEVERKLGEQSVRQGEITPGSKMPILLPSAAGIVPELYVWGFRMPKSLVINARAETATDKAMFRECVAHRRCIVPASAFYEWDAQKRKYSFALPDSSILYMAGLYDLRSGIPCYCIITTAANESIQKVHNRMPLILEGEAVEAWLKQPETAADILQSKPPQLTMKSLDEQMGLW